jgi:hypothetical protein
VFFIQQFTLELLLLSLRETLCATRADAKGGGGAGSASSSSNHIILKHLKYLRRLASSSCYYIFLINYALNIPTTARALSRALIFEAAAIIVSQTAHSPPFLRRSSIFLVQIILCARESRRAGGRASESGVGNVFCHLLTGIICPHLLARHHQAKALRYQQLVHCMAV